MNKLLVEHECNKCGVELSNDNWYPSKQKEKNCICKKCVQEYNRSYREANRDEMNLYARLHRKNDPENAKEIWTKHNRKNGMLPMSKNKECTLYYGVHINERLLKLYFNDVEVMPMHHPDYDFICKNDWKIDGKSSFTGDKGRWQFNIKRNTITDYFFCVAYDNRKDMNILRIWILPGKKFNHLAMATISKSTIDKWAEYEQPLDKVIKCCDSMKAQATCEMRYLIDDIWDESDAEWAIEASQDEKGLQ